MSKDKQNSLEFWERDDRAQTDLENAENRFLAKTFYEQWLWARKLCTISAKVLPFISISTGLVAVASAVGSLVPWLFISYPIAFVVLLGWELGKGRIIDTFSELAYVSIRKAMYVAPVAVLFAPVSYTHLTLPTICSV